jgi:hypothetical protein
LDGTFTYADYTLKQGFGNRPLFQLTAFFIERNRTNLEKPAFIAYDETATGERISVLKVSAYVVLLVGFLIASCQLKPTQVVALGDTLLEEDFSESYAWENYADPAIQVDFRVEDGVYRAQARDGGFMWALNAQAHTNVAIQVDTQQLSEYANNAYGVICRGSPSKNGDGYYFMISGDGNYTLRRGSTDRVRALIPWTYSPAIQQGRSINRIRVICIDDYLALYVNGEFVAETRDNYFSQGYAGLTAAVPEGGDVDVTFDNLRIWSAGFAGEQ